MSNVDRPNGWDTLLGISLFAAAVLAGLAFGGHHTTTASPSPAASVTVDAPAWSQAKPHHP